MSLGFEYEIEDGLPVVRRVDADGPADRVGIKAGDKILEVDGMPTAGGQDILSILSGEPGDAVVLQIQPAPRSMSSEMWSFPGAGGSSAAAQPRTVTVTRDSDGWTGILQGLSSLFSPTKSPTQAASAGPSRGEEERSAGSLGAGRDAGVGSGKCGVGIGIAVDSDGTKRVTEVVAGTPAAGSGMILVGDELISVDGIEVAGIGRAAMCDLLLGQPGTDCRLTLRRTHGAALVTVSLTRAPYKRPSAPRLRQTRLHSRGGPFTWSLWPRGPFSYWSLSADCSSTEAHDRQAPMTWSRDGDRFIPTTPTARAGSEGMVQMYQEHQGLISEEEALQLAYTQSISQQEREWQHVSGAQEIPPSHGDRATESVGTALGEEDGPYMMTDEDLRAYMQMNLQDLADRNRPQDATGRGGRRQRVHGALGSRMRQTRQVWGVADAQRPPNLMADAQGHEVWLEEQGPEHEIHAQRLQHLLDSPGFHAVLTRNSLIGMDAEGLHEQELLLAGMSSTEITNTSPCSPAVISSLPVSEFKTSGRERSQSADRNAREGVQVGKSDSADSPDTQCCICISEYEQGDRVARLPCFHTFHHHCLVRWLESSSLCPICKSDVQQREASLHQSFSIISSRNQQ